MQKILIVAVVLIFQIVGYSQEMSKEEVIDRIGQSGNDTSKVGLLLKLADIERESSRKRAIQHLNEALELSNNLSFKKGQADAHFNLGNLYYSESEYQKSIDNYQQALTIFTQLSNKSRMSKCFFGLGRSYSKQRLFDNAIESYKNSISYSQEIGDLKFTSSVLYNLGISYRRKNDLAMALKYYIQSMKMKEELNDDAGISSVLNSMGLLYFNDGQYNKAIESFNQSLELKRETGDKKGEAMVLNNLGLTYDKTKDYSNAIYFYNESLKVKLKYGETKLGTIYLNLGLVYGKTDSLEQSREYLSRALILSQKYRNKRVEAKCNNLLGAVFHKEAKYDTAIGYLLQGLEISKKSGAIDITKYAEGLLSDCYARQGKFEEAYNHHQQYKQLTDSIININNKRELARVQSQYELEQHKEKISRQEIQLEINQIINYAFAIGAGLFLLLAFVFFTGRTRLRKSNEELEKKNREIENQKKEIESTNILLLKQKDELVEANSTKDKLFSIIGHDLRSPIGNLDSVFDTLLEKDIDLNDDEIKLLLQSLQKSTETALNLLENLLFWANSQRGRLEVKPLHCSLKYLVKENLRLFNQGLRNKDITLKSEIDSKLITYFDKDMLNFIFRNLISNAIKFSYPGGEIFISAKHESSSIEVIISDKGVGISDESINQIFKNNAHLSTRGTLGEPGTGLGLQLCNEFLQRNHGAMQISSVVRTDESADAPGGSDFILSLPVDQQNLRS